MAEIDYQMALLLQHRFEQEYKALKNSQKSDEELARQLQEQFNEEEAINKPAPGLVYKQPKTDANTSRSLVDPSWELVDPTPDIHTLFMVFNERFFWNKLLAVCVSWSKRMTSCAGVCSYNGRGGLCSITLSEPLLKLRPRKDLVETLLHEMIHAYLFVTHNNRDRDGHGPEFHKHMFRINKEAGTNITVYHDFHDEVRLYQQHWWRCDGPCQHWKPYFGMVRRATNRAPGPNDRWWAEHSRSCGGTFIKVKEPEKNPKTSKKIETKGVTTNVKCKDIRDFMTPVVKNTESSNVKGFSDLTNKVKGKFNSSSTIVVTKTNNETESSYKPTVFNGGGSTIRKTETSTGFPVDARTRNEYSDEYLSVRNHWANKFSSTNKRPALEEPSTSSTKVPRKSELVPNEEYCECPICNQRMLMSDLNSHLDDCLVVKSTESDVVGSPKEEKKECPLCNSAVNVSIFDTHVEKCLMKLYDGVEKELDKNESLETVSCLACGKKVLKTDLNSHLEDCMLDIFDAEFDNKDSGKEEEKDSVDDQTNSQFNCPFCMKLVEEDKMKEHIDVCLKEDNPAIIELLEDEDF